MGRKKLIDKKGSDKNNPKNIKKNQKANKASKGEVIKKSSDKNFARLLGMKDVLSPDYKFLSPIINKIEETANSYSFNKIETPILEDFSLYKKLLDKHKLKNLFFIEQKGLEKIVLRPDLIHGMARALVEHGNLNNLEKPIKSFVIGPVFRQEKVRGGVYRQFNQFNFSIINDSKPVTDSFLIFFIYNIFKELQIDVQVQINSLGDHECQKEFLHKFSKFLKEKGRRSKLCNDCKKNVLKSPSLLLECMEESCLNLRNEMPQIIEFLSEEGNARFYKTMEFLDKMDINYNFNPYLTRDLGYYNDIIFEIWPVDKNGELNPKLSLGRGGRYDNLFSRLSGRDIPFIGFSGGIERTLIKSKENNLFIDDDKDVIFLAQVDVSAKSRAMTLFKELLNKGFNIKQAFHLDGLRDQLDEARNLKAKKVLILGKKELNEETILFRDTESGVQEIIAQKDLISRIEKSFYT